MPLWPLEQTATLIHERLARLLTPGPDGLPQGVADDPDASWECRYCPVVDACRQVALEHAQDT